MRDPPVGGEGSPLRGEGSPPLEPTPQGGIKSIMSFVHVIPLNVTIWVPVKLRKQVTAPQNTLNSSEKWHFLTKTSPNKRYTLDVCPNKKINVTSKSRSNRFCSSVRGRLRGNPPRGVKKRLLRGRCAETPPPGFPRKVTPKKGGKN